MRPRTLVLGIVSMAAAVAGVFLASGVVVDVVAPSDPPEAVAWPGLKMAGFAVRELPRDDFVDPPEAAVPFIDIVQFSAGDGPGGELSSFGIQLAGPPPRAATLDPAETVITYGLVLDTTGDGFADQIACISNEAPDAGDFRVWLTDITTGTTWTQVGGPYGFPFDFFYPGESDAQPEFGTLMEFTLFGEPQGERYLALSPTTRFYAWTSLTRGSVVTAWDYAPDEGWLTLPAP